ncbi:uncharacterized protein ACRADG_012228 [Cochliomyia hominivorax]
MKQILYTVVFIFMVSRQLHASFGSYWNKLAAVTEGSCAVQNVKLLSLLNLLCNTTQTTSIQMRDACYGCFFRAGSIINGPTLLSSLNDCARLYIAESEYATCAANLQALVDGNRPQLPDPSVSGFCFTGYCDFVRCVRRINARQLISTCYAESLGMRELESDSDRIYFYTNITSCILAKSRCAQYNPISGELQNQIYVSGITPTGSAAVNKLNAATNGWVRPHPPLPTVAPPTLYFNSLQVSENGDIRIITFPTTSASITDLFCSRFPNLQQAGFGTYNC